MENHVYNIMRQIVEEHTSLWRLKNDYTADAQGYPEEAGYWEKLSQDKEQHITDMTNMLREYLG